MKRPGSEPFDPGRSRFYLQQSEVHLLQQSAEPSQQVVHLSVQHAGQHPLLADVWLGAAKAVTVRTTATARTENIRFIRNFSLTLKLRECTGCEFRCLKARQGSHWH
jgi:hypothetical protein